MQAGYPGKRLFDVVGAAVALVVSMPLQMVVAVTIKIDSRGPVLSRQTRIGAGGRPFQKLKFRTLTFDPVDADGRRASLGDGPGAGPLFKMRSDPRLTRAGRFLRPSSLDELPQLVNVLRGDMSLVGPRALHVGVVDESDQISGWRLLVKPGMTGLSQVSDRSKLAWDEEVRLDLSYVDNASMRLDLVILARTLARSVWALMGLMRSMFARSPMVW